jgi:hypothetical protein
MKLTKTKLKQLIREALAETKMDFSWGTNPPPDTSTPSGQADYEDWERRTRGHEAFVAMGEEEEEGKDLLASLSKEEKELAEDILGWWARQVDEIGRLSGLTGKDGSVQNRLWADEVFTNPPPGFRLTEKHLEFALEALESLPQWEPKNSLVPETKELALKIEEILAGDEPEKQPEPEVPEDEKVNQRFAHLDIPSDESMAARAVKRYKEGKSFKLTKTLLHGLIQEELSKLMEDGAIGYRGEEDSKEDHEIAQAGWAESLAWNDPRRYVHEDEAMGDISLDWKKILQTAADDPTSQEAQIRDKVFELRAAARQKARIERDYEPLPVEENITK